MKMEVTSFTPREGPTLTPRAKRKHRGRGLIRSHSQHDVRSESTPSDPANTTEATELSVDFRAPGLLKIFGETVVAGARYKSVLASTRSTAQELIKQALERYGLPSRLHADFVLCETVGTVGNGDRGGGDSIKTLNKKATASEEKRSHRNRSPAETAFLSSSVFTSSHPEALSTSSSSVKKHKKHLSPRTPRSARSLTCGRKHRDEDRSVCSTPRTHYDSPRTPLGSPRTPCGSPSICRGSPRASLPLSKSGSLEQQLLNYQPPSKVTDTARTSVQLRDIYRPRGERIPRAPNSLVSCNGAGNNSPRIINVLKDSSKNSKNLPHDNSWKNVHSDEVPVCDNISGWVQVYIRVLSPGDRPLELQDFWKPPEGFSRRFELRRRTDVIFNGHDDVTLGLNHNARKIMMSKVSPGVIPVPDHEEDRDEVNGRQQGRTTIREEWERASMGTNAIISYASPRDNLLTNVVEGDPRQAYVCPSIYPYLLTLRGCSIQKDLVLYPLKSRTLCIGSAEKKSHSDDIKLCADDVSDVHCRVTLKRLPQGGEPVDQDKRQYWYCLDLDIYRSAYVSVNGIQVKQKATVLPGDLLGIGRQYLFLYKDPTGGHDIPSEVPWLPDQENPVPYPSGTTFLQHHQQQQQNMAHDHVDAALLHSDQPNSSQDITNPDFDDTNVLDDSTLRDAAIFLAYHRDKEVEVLENIAEVKAWSKGDYPLSLAVLYLAAHHYATRKFSGDHQTTFFRRLARVVRAKVGIVSKSLSVQKQPSAVFKPDQKLSSSEVDHFPHLVTWLANTVTLVCHFRTSQFQSYVSGLARKNDVSTALQETLTSLEETVNCLFQQTVYSVTKVLYEPINSLMQSVGSDKDSTSNRPITRIVNYLTLTHQLACDLCLHNSVNRQLMTYLLFFISTTLFNRIISKGSQFYNREAGLKLQSDVSELEKWSNGMNLEGEFVRVSEHLMSLTDLLASSKRSLLKLDWSSFQRQFSPLTDIQLCKVLGEYQLGDGQVVPAGWYPPQPLDLKQDLTLSLSSHPPFVIPKQGLEISLSDSFPPSFFRHLEQIQQRFCLTGEDIYCSGLSSAGNTPRLSESINKSQGTFYSQEALLQASLGATSRQLTTGGGPLVTRSLAGLQGDEAESRTSKGQGRSSLPKPPPPPVAPKPEPTQPVPAVQHNPTSGPPSYNTAMRDRKRPEPTRAEPQSVPSELDPEERLKRLTTAPIPKPRQATGGHNDVKIQPLPDFNDKLLRQNGPLNGLRSGLRDHSHQKPGSKQPGPPHRPILKTQNSWVHNTNVGLFQRRREAQGSELSNSYPFVRPRPSSASDYSPNTPNSSDHDMPQFMTLQQREQFLEKRSNSVLGNTGERYNTIDENSSLERSHSSNSLSGSGPRVHIMKPQPLHTNHNNMSNHRGKDILRAYNNNYGPDPTQPTASLDVDKNSLRNKVNHQRSAPSTIREDGVEDTPPPLPPKGEMLRQRLSTESQKSLDNNGIRNTSRDSDPYSSPGTSTSRPRSGSRTSVEIQDITENRYIIYNPDLPVKEIFDHNQNLQGIENRNLETGVDNPNGKQYLKVPPLDLPDDLLGASGSESPDDVFDESMDKSGKRPAFLQNGVKKSALKVKPRVEDFVDSSTELSLALHNDSQARTSTSSDKFPDDIYIDVEEFEVDPSAPNSAVLKVLPLDDANRKAGVEGDSGGTIAVRYRHVMPDARDIATKGEVTGEVFTVSLDKAGSKLGMGLIDGMHTCLKLPGIYVRNVLPDTPAALCGCIRVGDRILAVNGKSIVGADYQSAMKLIRSSGPRLHLLVAKCDRSVAAKISASNA